MAAIALLRREKAWLPSVPSKGVYDLPGRRVGAAGITTHFGRCLSVLSRIVKGMRTSVAGATCTTNAGVPTAIPSLRKNVSALSAQLMDVPVAFMATDSATRITCGKSVPARLSRRKGLLRQIRSDARDVNGRNTSHGSHRIHRTPMASPRIASLVQRLWLAKDGSLNLISSRPANVATASRNAGSRLSNTTRCSRCRVAFVPSARGLRMERVARSMSIMTTPAVLDRGRAASASEELSATPATPCLVTPTMTHNGSEQLSPI